MSVIDRIQSAARPAALLAALAAGLMLTGCGTSGAPQPPSLNLPNPVADLAASRAGNQVALTWTMPRKNTDKLLLKGNVTVRICRKEGANGDCDAAGDELSLAPATEGAFTDTLPAALIAGSARPLSYFVELRNRNGRSAGLSNAAQVLAGVAPAPVANFTAEVRKAGVVLRWTNLEAAAQEAFVIRLHRKLLNPPAAKPHEDLLTMPAEPAERSLLVDSCAPAGRMGACRALDQEIRFGETYEYRAQRVARVTVDGKTLELDGALSAPVRVAALDIFPPEVPTGLAAVATTGEDNAAPASQNAPQNALPNAIDLSWQPATDANLAGYALYRREGDSRWQRISSAEPLVPPAFHDAQVLPGHTYRYAVSAIGQNGHESARSAEVAESVPNP
jgi:hypothetical protein